MFDSNLKMSEEDPGVWEREGKWYCYGVECSEEGPFSTREEAERARDRFSEEWRKIMDQADPEGRMK